MKSKCIECGTNTRTGQLFCGLTCYHANTLKVDNNNLKYDAAIEYCKLNNYQYRIITEKDLK